MKITKINKRTTKYEVPKKDKKQSWKKDKEGDK